MRWTEQNTSPQEGSTGAPTIKNHSVTHFKGFLYCFGGYDGRRNHLTLLMYSIDEKKWIRPISCNLHEPRPFVEKGPNPIYVTGTPPPGRNGHSATLATDPDDDDIGRIIIIGGWLGTGPLAASDMHVLDISNAGRELRWYQPAVRGTPPGPCNMHSADYVPLKREVYVFRGGNGREYLNDLHALDPRTFMWRKVETTGAIPQQRANHSSAVLEETGELFIFGGWNGTERLNDIHILDTATSTWTRPQAGGVLPHPRAGMTLTALRGRLYLFGGSGTSSKCFQDLQILDRSEMAWLDVTQNEMSANHPGRHRYEVNHPNSNDPDVYQSPDWSFQKQQIRGNEMDIDTDSQMSMSYGQDYWDSRSLSGQARSDMVVASPNPNDEESRPTVVVHGKGPGRRAGHTATAVNRKIFVFGGSCGSDYLNDFFVLDTDPAPRAVVNEPTGLNLVGRHLRHFCNDEEFSDVTFLVQGRKIYGHKIILCIVSDIFRAMFTAGFRESESKDCEIEISDASYDSFLAVMEYIYTGQTPKMNQPGNNNDDNEATISRMVDILQLADRFFLDHLKQVCEKLLQKSINGDTVEYFLQVAQKTNSSQLQIVCEHFLRNRDAV